VANPTYNWQRYWRPVERANPLDEGYLQVYESPQGTLYPQDIVRFNQIAGTPCLVLLGEAGMGKTHAMHEEEKAIRAQGQQSLLVNLGSLISDSAALVRYLFESDTFKAWTTGTHHLHLFLDGYDECQSSFPTLGAVLVTELKRHCNQLNRLSLRIACRAGAWRTELEGQLRQLWNCNEVGVYELAPLTVDNVREAALVNQLNADAFIQDVYRQDVIPLAARPVTLELLLKSYQEESQIPSNQVDLYRRGCLHLCSEYTENRQAVSQLDAHQRLAIAARIAAITMLTGQSVIGKTLTVEEMPSQGVIPMEDIEGGEEQFERNGFPKRVLVDKATISETLTTGLFCIHGPNQFRWTHQTYAEFLAAWYLKQQQLPLPQIKSLLFLPDGKVIPQLRGLAAWMASLLPEIFEAIAQADPDVLLLSRVLTDEPEARAKLLESLLNLCNQGALSGQSIAIFRIDGRGPRLAHPKLAEQLQPWICNTSQDKDEDSRCLAVEIARACRVSSLQDSLVNIALDPSESPLVRENAAQTVCEIADEETKVRLKPLAFEEAGTDPKQELKTWGLRALWPNHISIQELLSFLTSTRQKYFGGEYQEFIAHEITENLQPQELAIALQWLETKPNRRDLAYPFSALSDNLMRQAWDRIELPEILEAFSRIVLKRLREHDEIIGHYQEPSFETLLAQEDNKRRSLIQAIFPMVSDQDLQRWVLFSHFTPLILDKDFAWMLNCLSRSEEESDQQRWAKLIWKAFRGLPGQHDAILTACQISTVLAKEFAPLIFPIPLNTEQSCQLHQEYLQRQRWEQELNQPHQSRPPLNPLPKQRIINFVDSNSFSNPSLWPRLVQELTLQPENTHYGDFWSTDITTFPGWQEAEDLTRSKLCMVAKEYLFVGDPETQRWLGTSKVMLQAHAGYLALELLQKQQPTFIDSLAPDIWEKWAATLLDRSSSSTVENVQIRDRLVRLAYRYACQTVLSAFERLLDAQNQANRTLEIPEALKNCWDDDLEQMLLNKVKSGSLKPYAVGKLLESLLDKSCQDAQTYAQSLIPSPLPTDPEQRSAALYAARALLFHAKGGGWSVVWPAFQQDPAFGREVVKTMQFLSLGGQPAQLEHPEQLKDLYIWLSQQYPYTEWVEADATPDALQPSGDCIEEHVHYWGNAILHQLRDSGEYQAIQNIMQAFPEQQSNLKWLLVEAQNITRSHEWRPPTSQEILELLRNKESRYVRSGEDLLNVVQESLERLQQKFDRNETLAVIDVWNEISPKLFKSIIRKLLNPLKKTFLGLDSNVSDLLDSSPSAFYTPKDENTAVFSLMKDSSSSEQTSYANVEGPLNPSLLQ